jgi:hypothetical protein
VLLNLGDADLEKYFRDVSVARGTVAETVAICWEGHAMLGKAGVPIVIGACVLLIVMLYVYWPRGSQPHVPPSVLAERALTSTDAGEQQEAAGMLGDWGQVAYESDNPETMQELSPVFARVYRESNNPKVRAEALRGITTARDWSSMDVVFEALDDEDAVVRGRAGAAATKLLGVDFGYRANDPQDKRDRIVQGMRGEYEKMQSALSSSGMTKPEYGTK